MIDIFVDKLYRYDRIEEPCFVAVPVKEGELRDADRVRVYQEGRALPDRKSTRLNSSHM